MATSKVFEKCVPLCARARACVCVCGGGGEAGTYVRCL
jgi:hypothetical protein